MQFRECKAKGRRGDVGALGAPNRHTESKGRKAIGAAQHRQGSAKGRINVMVETETSDLDTELAVRAVHDGRRCVARAQLRHDTSCHKFRADSRCSKDRRDDAGAIGTANRRPQREVRGTAAGCHMTVGAAWRGFAPTTISARRKCLTGDPGVVGLYMNTRGAGCK